MPDKKSDRLPRKRFWSFSAFRRYLDGMARVKPFRATIRLRRRADGGWVYIRTFVGCRDDEEGLRRASQ